MPLLLKMVSERFHMHYLLGQSLPCPPLENRKTFVYRSAHLHIQTIYRILYPLHRYISRFRVLFLQKIAETFRAFQIESVLSENMHPLYLPEFHLTYIRTSYQ